MASNRKTPKNPAPKRAAARPRKRKEGPSIASYLSDVAGGNYVSGHMGPTFAGPPHTDTSAESAGANPTASSEERGRRHGTFGTKHKHKRR